MVTGFVVLCGGPTLWEISYLQRKYATIPGEAGNPASTSITESVGLKGEDVMNRTTWNREIKKLFRRTQMMGNAWEEDYE